MSTITQPVITSGGSPTHPARPACPTGHALSASDFKVCESCGGPAMIHPRLELGASGSRYNGERRILCCACLHEAVLGGGTEALRILHQVWKCCECGKTRAWGFLEPWDSTALPALRCGSCDAVTRHRFVRVG